MKKTYFWDIGPGIVLVCNVNDKLRHDFPITEKMNKYGFFFSFSDVDDVKKTILEFIDCYDIDVWNVQNASFCDVAYYDWPEDIRIPCYSEGVKK